MSKPRKPFGGRLKVDGRHGCRMQGVFVPSIALFCNGQRNAGKDVYYHVIPSSVSSSAFRTSGDAPGCSPPPGHRAPRGIQAGAGLRVDRRSFRVSGVARWFLPICKRPPLTISPRGALMCFVFCAPCCGRHAGHTDMDKQGLSTATGSDKQH